MKKSVLALFTLVFSLGMGAQNLNGGLSLGLPVGDASDAYSFNLTLDINYLWNVSEAFEAGVATGLQYNFGKSIDIPLLEGSFDVDDAMFLPIAGTARYAVTEKFKLGADLGYAIGLAPSENDGGFYYAPKAQYSITDALDIVFAYRGVSVEGGNFNTLTLGVELGL